MKTILLTGNHLRHQYIASYVATQTNLLGVWREEKSFDPLSYASNEEESQVIRDHFLSRDQSEEKYFGAYAEKSLPGNIPVYDVCSGTLNSEKYLAAMKACTPDVVLVCGTGILREELINLFPGHIINIHLGLSPYYRGAGTNFWPLVNREPEYLGATIHYLDKGIDTGEIIAHCRPEVNTEDGPHDMGNKTIMVATKVLVEIARLHVARKIKSVPQWKKGKLYQRKDFGATAVAKLYENFRSGMIAEYLQSRGERDQALKLIAQGDEE